MFAGIHLYMSLLGIDARIEQDTESLSSHYYY